MDFNVTILCGHTFNWKCLIGYGNIEDEEIDETSLTCPLCRFYQSPQPITQCDACDVTDDMYSQQKEKTLWTCLICGHVGCLSLGITMQDGSLEASHNGHAYEHYQDSMHVYAMEVQSKKVWDFSKQDYV